MNRYPAYKDSGVEWIGEIPEHWEESKFKHLFKEIYRYPTYYGINYESNGVLEVRGEMLKEGGKIDYLNSPRFISSETSNKFPRTKLESGDIVMTVRGTLGKIGIVPDEIEGSNITANLMRLSPVRKIIFPRYLPYLLESYYFRNILEYSSDQTTIKTITVPDLVSSYLPIPPGQEQQSISNYLNQKTHQIDALIEKKQKQIDLLKEQRTAIINQAVAKGLNPNVKMKDSGIEWLGKIPEHWDIVRVGRVATLQRGVDITKDQQIEGSIPVVSSGGIKSYHNQFFRSGPGVVVGRKGTVGSVYYIPSDYWPHDTTLYIKDFHGNHPKFIYYKLLSMNLERYDTGSANPTLNRNVVHPEPISWPQNDSEQIRISKYLDKKTENIDGLIDKIHIHINFLKEYRTTLISNVVTGKIDVRDEVLQ